MTSIKHSSGVLFLVLILLSLSACSGKEAVGVVGLATFEWPKVQATTTVVAGNTKQTLELEVLDTVGDMATFEVTIQPQQGVLDSLQSTGPFSATIDYTPDPDFHGRDSFEVRATDLAGYQTTGTFELVINNGDPGYDDRLALAVTCNVRFGPLSGTAPWPSMLVDIYDEQLAIDARQAYQDQGHDHTVRVQTYDALGDYLNYGSVVSYQESDTLMFDGNGVPMNKYGDQFFYNPDTVATYALSEYGKYLAGSRPIDGFLSAAEVLKDQQDERGALPYPFEWRHYLMTEAFEPGWTSGMAQGLALSVFYRAYDASGDSTYLDAGNLALDYLQTPTGEGGVKDTLSSLAASLESYEIIEQYMTAPSTYTLNGFMFAMLGLHDWSNTSGANAAVAQSLFDSSLRTLEAIIPYFEMGGFSSFDLGHLTFENVSAPKTGTANAMMDDASDPNSGVAYHALHISQLHALVSLTNNSCLDAAEQQWISHLSLSP